MSKSKVIDALTTYASAILDLEDRQKTQESMKEAVKAAYRAVDDASVAVHRCLPPTDASQLSTNIKDDAVELELTWGISEYGRALLDEKLIPEAASEVWANREKLRMRRVRPA